MKPKKRAVIFSIFLIFFIFYSLNIVSASSQLIKKGDSIPLVIPVVNNDNSPVSNTINCSISINYPNGLPEIQNQQMSFSSPGQFNYTLNSSYSQTNGDYVCSISCTDNVNYGFSSFTCYTVTPSGTVLSISQSFIYLLGIIVVFLISFFLMRFGLFGSEKTMAKQKNSILEIDYSSYSRFTAFFVGWIFVAVFFYLIYGFMSQFIVTDFISQFFFILYMITIISWIPFFFGIGAFMLIDYVRKAQDIKIIQRGLNPENRRRKR